MYEKLRGAPSSIRFTKLCNAAEAFGFKYRGGKGSHRIYTREVIPEILNFQDVDGMAKPH